jgi:hypothetical protein
MPLLHYENFTGKGVLSFSSDSSLDFLQSAAPAFSAFKLTIAQREALTAGGISGEVIFPKQVHGDVIWEVLPKDVALSGVFEADAVVTTTPELAIAVRTADCLPLLMVASKEHVIAAVHAGWKSTRLEIAMKTVRLLKLKYGVDPSGIKAVIGPCIRPQSYPVGPDFKEFFPAEVKVSAGCLCFDISAANHRQLLSEGVRAANIFDCGEDTYANARWHSFRRDSDASGRLIHVIMLKRPG